MIRWFYMSLWLSLGAWGLFPVPFALAQQNKEVKTFSRSMDLAMRGGQLSLSLSFPEVFTARMKNRLASGFTSYLIVEVLVWMDGVKNPVASGVAQFIILYDIWDERYSVRQAGPWGVRQLGPRSLSELIQVCGSLVQMQLLQMQTLPEKANLRVEAVITVNPASEEQKRKVREYMANPDGRRYIGSPRSFFGSFSRMFVNEKDIRADAVYSYRSPSIPWPKPQPASK